MNKKLILMALLIITVTPSIFANTTDCATVSTRTSFLKNNEYSLMLLNRGTVKSTIYLTPGIHKLSAKIKYNKKDRSNNPNTYTFVNEQEISELIRFNIDVKENTMYQVVATTKDKHKRNQIVHMK